MTGSSLKHSLIELGELEEGLFHRVIEMDLEFFPRPWSQQQWQNSKGLNYYKIALSQSQDKVLGFSLFMTFPDEKMAHLLKILIHPDSRNKGHGHKHLSFVLNEFKNFDINKFLLEVDTNNEFAIKLYQSLNFKEIDKKMNYYGQAQNAFIMECLIE